MSAKPRCPHARRIRVAAVGDRSACKTSLLKSFVMKQYHAEQYTTFLDVCEAELTVDEQPFRLNLVDTSGFEEYDNLRPLFYSHTDCFLLCFSVRCRASYEKVESRWSREIKILCPNVPIVLVATETEHREKCKNSVSEGEGMKLRRRIKAARYIECSALNMQGVEQVFEEAVRAAREKRKRRCTIL